MPQKSEVLPWQQVLSMRSDLADYFVKTPYWDQVQGICDWAARENHVNVGSMVSGAGYEHTYNFLDGDCYRSKLFGHRAGVWLNGTRVTRYILYRLDATQLPLHSSEQKVPSFRSLLDEVREGRRPYEKRLLAQRGELMLTVALRSGRYGEVMKLVKKGVEVDFSKPTFLHCAVRAKSPRLVEFLLSRGADPNRGPDMMPPLAVAVNTGSLPVCRILVEAGADPQRSYKGVLCGEWREDNYLTPLSLAESLRKKKLIQFFDQAFSQS
jgi:hypothetical protein